MRTSKLSERSQTQRPHFVWFHWHKMPQRGKSKETESRLLLAWGRGKRDWEVTANRIVVSFGGDENVWNSTVVTVAQPCWHTKKPQNCNFKMANFMIWELYLNLKVINWKENYKFLKTRLGWWLHISVKLKTTEMHTLNEWLIWYVN